MSYEDANTLDARQYDTEQWLLENTDLRPEEVTVRCWYMASPPRHEVEVSVARGVHRAIIRGPGLRTGGAYRKSIYSWSEGSWVSGSEAIEFIRLMLSICSVAEHLDRQLAPHLEEAGLVLRDGVPPPGKA